MSRWNSETEKCNMVSYKGYTIGRRDIFETINYYNAYWILQYLKNFIDERVKNDNIETLRNLYTLACKIQYFSIFLYEEKNDKKISDLTEDDGEDFLYYLKNVRKLKESRIYFGFAKRLCDYMIACGELTFNPFNKAHKMVVSKEKKKSYTTNTISEEQIEIAREKLPDHLKMYMFLILSTGIKSYQLRMLKWENIDFENRIIVIDDNLYFSQEIADILKHEKKRRTKEGLNDYGYVFRSDVKQYFEKDTPISKSTEGRWCTDIGQAIGIDNLRPLDFRHTAIRKFLTASGSVGMTSIILNHPNLSQSVKYLLDDNVNNDLLQEYKDICEI